MLLLAIEREIEWRCRLTYKCQWLRSQHECICECCNETKIEDCPVQAKCNRGRPLGPIDYLIFLILFPIIQTRPLTTLDSSSKALVVSQAKGLWILLFATFFLLHWLIYGAIMVLSGPIDTHYFLTLIFLSGFDGPPRAERVPFLKLFNREQF